MPHDPFATLPDITDLQPLSGDDHKCLDEIESVLLKHGKQNRFGISLLHQHFKVQPNEILVERCDKTNRTLTIQPVEKSKVPLESVVETNWILGRGHQLVCIQTCVDMGDVGHWDHDQGQTN